MADGANNQYFIRSRRLICALRGDEAVYWVSIGQQNDGQTDLER